MKEGELGKIRALQLFFLHTFAFVGLQLFVCIVEVTL